MTPQYFRNAFLSIELFAIIAHCAHLNYSGEAVTTRFWDCCKPSCAWNGKADVSKPVYSCSIDDKPTDILAGTACGTGGTAYQCSNQQPWAINDTLSYGFAGAFIMPDLTHGGIEGAWCCACYQLDFTSDPLRGKSLIVQASNTAYDITTTNRFSIAMPGGNTTSQNACAQQYGVGQSVFGSNNMGVRKKEDCQNLPGPLRDGCNWRFDWFKDTAFPTANFKRVVCPAELTQRSGCARNDDKVLSGEVQAAAPSLSPGLSITTAFAAMMLGVLSI
ncbi:endoglucanase 1 precursor [Ophiobolus disseminans]|uniref:cellulase n=1 Tax=Ophiobolus disseminans TaxID=1469910 RepID=A0A6A7ABD1_9PLEO|nr:endoglucanase 1 precursor [Ophiobolus disseminans]